MSKEENLFAIRREYKQQELLERNVAEDPLQQFRKWLQEAFAADVPEPTAMTLATSTKSGRPTSRIVLLKNVSEQGLSFFTNYNSRKGNHIEENPYGCLSFFWPQLERQVRVEGSIKKTTPEESREYFSSRPIGSQLGAVASPQSSRISKAELITRENEVKDKYGNTEVPCPEHWGGFVLTPVYLEFWQGRPNRMHDRIVYERKGSEWEIFRIAP